MIWQKVAPPTLCVCVREKDREKQKEKQWKKANTYDFNKHNI